MKYLFKKKYIKIILTNFYILIFLLFSPALIFKFFKIAKNNFEIYDQKTSDIRANYPTYKNKELSNQIFFEQNKVTYKFRAYLGWKSDPLKTKYTNILGKYNSRYSVNQSLNKSIWFFGGSTVWGTGVSDQNTIPSFFSKLTNKKVYNFGESGWTSRQSLNQLINLIGDGEIPKKVIFYDGINEVEHLCRANINDLPNYFYENRIKNQLFSNSVKLFSIKIKNFILEPYKKIAQNLSKTNVNNFAHSYNCDSDKDKSKRIAKHLITNWENAYLLAKSKNSSFLAILQPTIFSSDVNFDYLEKNELRKFDRINKQFNAVYPVLIKEIKKVCEKDIEFCKTIKDGRFWLKNKENIFIDFFHVVDEGNKIIADKLSNI